MNILVTGGAGFIGAHVVEMLVKLEHQVLVLDNFWTGKTENLREVRDAIWLTNQDIQYPIDLTNWPYQPEALIHLAAQAAITESFLNPKQDLLVNALGTYNVVELAKALKVKRVVMASTSAVYEEKNTLLRETDAPRPGSPYGVSKLAGENYLRGLFPESVALRLGNVYGPRQVSIGENQVVARMIDHVLWGTPFFIHGDGEQKRDYVYVEDVARAFLLGLEADPGVYNVGTGHGTSVNTVAALVARAMKREIAWKHDTLEDSRRDVHMAVKLAQSKLEWEPMVGLSEGIRRTVEYSRQQLPEMQL